MLRSKVDEISRVGSSNRQVNATETFSGDNSTKQFTVTNTPLQCVNSLTVGGVAQVKHVDYNIDLDNSRVNFAVAPASGSNNISIDCLALGNTRSKNYS